MPKPEPMFSISDCAVILRRDQGNLSRALADLEPDHQTSRAKKYYLYRVLQHLQGGDLDPSYERARLAKEQADKLALENAVTRGELAPVEWYSEKLNAALRQVAAMLNALPLRIRQLLPHLTQIDHARIERHLAEERARLADGLAEGSGDLTSTPEGRSGPSAGSAAAAAQRVG